MGRKFKILLVTTYKKNVLYRKLKKFFLENGYEVITEDYTSNMMLKAGSKLWTYAFGTWRWSKAYRTLNISIVNTEEGSNAELRYDVSWLTSIGSLVKTSRVELYKLKTFIKPKNIMVALK